MQNNQLCENLKKLREKFGLNQEELAEKLDVSSQAVSKWETGESTPALKTLIIIARMFAVSIDALIFGLDTWDEEDGKLRTVNYKLKQLYYRNKHNEPHASLVKDVVALILPIYDEAEKDYFWVYAARNVVKGTIYAMLEDPQIDENNFNVAKIKEILRLSSADMEQNQTQIQAYFANKSVKCQELIGVVLGAARSTASSIMGYVATYLNLLSE